MNKPLIGLTLDHEITKTYSKFPWYAIRENYFIAIQKAGGIGIALPHNITEIKYYAKFLDGLLITGGDFDINPNLFGSSFRHNKVNTKEKRTIFEIKITKAMLGLNKPVLGICGGEQLINVASGGDLIQDINETIKTDIEHEQINPRNEVSHEIKVIKKSKLYEITKRNKIAVNSAHHQSVNNLGKNFISSALAPDGVVEAIEHINHPWCLGLQWHPEFLITSSDIAIIKDFVNHAK